MARALSPWCTLLVLTAACHDEPARGKSCASNAECGDLACMAQPDPLPQDLSPLALHCGDALSAGAPGAACEVASDCEQSICLLAGACAIPCSTEQDCSIDARCQAVFARTATSALQTLSACVPRVSLPEHRTAALGTRTLPLTAGPNAITLDAVPNGNVALDILEHDAEQWPESGRCRTGLCIDTLTTLSAADVLFDKSADTSQGATPRNPVATGDHLDPVVVLLPSGSEPANASGYVATLDSTRAGQLRTTRIAHAPGGQLLDLNLFYVGAHELHPSGSRGPALVSGALDEVDRIFSQAGLAIGDVRQVDVTGSLPARGSAPEGDPGAGFTRLEVRYGVYLELPALFRLSAGASNAGVNVFFVGDIAPRPGDGEPQAESGGIPGPLGMQGTASSGIAIATDMMAGNPTHLGRTLAHELGHYLGLFHTSEADGSVLDGLSDTPECRVDRDQGHDGLDARDCEGAGADNLMFFADVPGVTLTGEQARILASAVILR